MVRNGVEVMVDESGVVSDVVVVDGVMVGGVVRVAAVVV